MPAPTLWGPKKLRVFLGIWLLVTWKSAFHDRPLEDRLGELGPVVVLVCHCDHNLHWVLNCIPVRRHGVREELQEPSECYLGLKRKQEKWPDQRVGSPWCPSPSHSPGPKYADTHSKGLFSHMLCCCFGEATTPVEIITPANL